MGIPPLTPRPNTSRRAFMAASLAAMGALALPESAGAAVRAPAGLRRTSRPETAPTMTFNLVNNTGSDQAYAFVTGYDINNGNALTLLLSDGVTKYYPPSPSQTLTPVGADIAIPLASNGGTRSITIPQLAAGRVWFSVGGQITFLLNPGPALVQPSVSNATDPNINLVWDFMEFTYNTTQLYCDTSCVDMVCLPVGLHLTQNGGPARTVKGLPAGAVNKVAAKLQAQAASDGQGWDQLIVTNGGANLRCLSPYNGMVVNNGLFSGYWEPYVSQVWSKYASQSLTVNTQESYGNVSGTVQGSSLVFPGVASFAMPTTADIFSCATGPFNPGGLGVEALAILARLAAAFNRSTLLTITNQPNGAHKKNYYQASPTNHYSRIVHSIAARGLGYAFPYDDVTPASGANQSGPLFSGNPNVLTVTVGAQH